MCISNHIILKNDIYTKKYEYSYHSIYDTYYIYDTRIYIYIPDDFLQFGFLFLSKA